MDAKALGIEIVDAPPPPEDFEVIPRAWPAVSVFLKTQTQWRTAMGSLLGFDYVAVKWLMELLGIENQLEVLDDLRVIEGRLIERMNDRKS